MTGGVKGCSGLEREDLDINGVGHSPTPETTIDYRGRRLETSYLETTGSRRRQARKRERTRLS